MAGSGVCSEVKHLFKCTGVSGFAEWGRGRRRIRFHYLQNAGSVFREIIKRLTLDTICILFLDKVVVVKSAMVLSGSSYVKTNSGALDGWGGGGGEFQCRLSKLRIYSHITRSNLRSKNVTLPNQRNSHVPCDYC